MGLRLVEIINITEKDTVEWICALRYQSFSRYKLLALIRLYRDGKNRKLDELITLCLEKSISNKDRVGLGNIYIYIYIYIYMDFLIFSLK